MARKIETIDDFDDGDGDETEYPDYAGDGCEACPDRWKCSAYWRYRIALFFGDLWLRIQFALEDAIIILAFPLVNAWNKHHGGIRCSWCGAYIVHVERADFCTHCGKPWIDARPEWIHEGRDGGDPGR